MILSEGRSDRCLLIGRLTKFSLLLCKFYRLRGFDVYYLFPEGKYKDISEIDGIEKLGIKWTSRILDKYSEHLRWWSICAEFTAYIYEVTSQADLHKDISQALDADEEIKNKLNVLWQSLIYARIEKFVMQYSIAELLLKSGGYKKVTTFTSTDFVATLKERGVLNKDIEIVVFPSGSSLRLLLQFLQKIVSYSFKTLGGRFPGMQSKTKPFSTVPIPEKQTTNAVKVEYAAAKVLFFPHQGIYYGDLFIKDQFYENDEDSFLHPTRIVHISLGELDKPFMRKTYDYYLQHRIPHIDIRQLPHKTRQTLRDVLSLIRTAKSNFFTDIVKFGLGYVLMVCMEFLKIRQFVHVFSHFSQAKIALAGYDYLFPKALGIALAHLGIKTCSTQERFIQAFYPDTYYLFDYYFVAGEVVKSEGLKTSKIEKIIPVGLVRVDSLFRYERNPVADEKYDEIKKKRKFVLALDYKFPENDFENESRYIGKVHQIQAYYNYLLRLAAEFPLLHIVIKGKDTDSYRSPYMKEILSEIEKLENIEIEYELEKYNPYLLGEKADLTIACHTSLVDELLAARKPVICVETSDYLDTLFHYKEILPVVDSYDGLKRNVMAFLEGRSLTPPTAETLRKEYYHDCYDGMVALNVRKILKQVLGE